MSCVQCGSVDVKFRENTTQSLYCSEVCQKKYYNAPLVGFKANPKLDWTQNMVNAIKDADFETTMPYFKKFERLRNDIKKATIESNKVDMLRTVDMHVKFNFYDLFLTTPNQKDMINYLLSSIGGVKKNEVSIILQNNRLDLFDEVFDPRRKPASNMIEEAMFEAFNVWVFRPSRTRAYVDSLIKKKMFPVNEFVRSLSSFYIDYGQNQNVLGAIRYVLQNGNGGIDPNNRFLKDFKREIENRNDLDTEKLLDGAIDRWNR